MQYKVSDNFKQMNLQTSATLNSTTFTNPSITAPGIPFDAANIADVVMMSYETGLLRTFYADHIAEREMYIISSTCKPGHMLSTLQNFGIVTTTMTYSVSYESVGSGKLSHKKATVYLQERMKKSIEQLPEDIYKKVCMTLLEYAKFTQTVQRYVHTANNMGMYTYNTGLEYFMDLNLVDEIETKLLPVEEYKYFVCEYTTKSKPLKDEIPAGVVYDDKHAFIALPTFCNAQASLALCNAATCSVSRYLTLFDIDATSPMYILGMRLKEQGVTTFRMTVQDTVPYISKSKFLGTVTEVDNNPDIPACNWISKLVNGDLGIKELPQETINAVCQTYGIKVTGGVTMDIPARKSEYDNDAYAQQLYNNVQSYYDQFDLKTLKNNIPGFYSGAMYSMLFIGDSGTGKSTAARVIPYLCGMPYISINFSVNLEESDIFGSMIPNIQKSSPNDPEFIWEDGILTKAIRNGYVAILEEINFARPGVLGKLNSLLDDIRQIDLPTGEIVKAHPNFRVIATCNIAYEGTNRMNKALINRFQDVTRFDNPTRDEMLKIIQTRTGYKDMKKIAKVYSVYEALKKYSDEQNLNLIISLRQMLTLFSNGRYYKNAEDAVTRIMLNSAFIEDPDFEQEFCKSVLPNFDLNFRL